jgi:MOSC domain-containing protein YiiM
VYATVHSTVAPVAFVLSVNLGTPREADHARLGVTGIDKRPVDHPMELRDPGPKGVGGSGLVGDAVCNLRHHGGTDQAVYAYAREDLDGWATRLGRPLPGGVFGENLTVRDLDVTGALIGARWQVGAQAVLEVTAPRIPCGNFAGWLGERGWVKTFARQAAPGAYLKVVRSGMVRAGDPITVVHRPEHEVTVGLVFRALTLEPELLPQLLAAPTLSEGIRRRARQGQPFELD